MEAFLLPVATSSADYSSSTLSEGGGSVCVGDADGDGHGGSGGADDGPFFLDFFWAGGLAESWSWDCGCEPLVSTSVAAAAAAEAATATVRA